MNKSTHAPEYRHVLDKLVSMRHEAGLTQRQLAEKMQREQSFIWRIEKGERRIDILEFFWLCEAMGHDPVQAYTELNHRFSAKQSKIIDYPTRKKMRKKVAERKEK